MKTKELTGLALNVAVSICEGWTPKQTKNKREDWMLNKGGTWIYPKHYRPSANWQVGGPIIIRQRISVRAVGGSKWAADDNINTTQYGKTPLEAVMRCYVASKLGESVDLPPQLL